MNTDSIISQFRTAAQHRFAALLGAAKGGVAPVITYEVAHHGVTDILDPCIALVAGGMVYSAMNVWKWVYRIDRNPWMATGWVTLIEGAMVILPDSLRWVSQLALGYLVVINAISTGCQIARDDQPQPAAPKVIATSVQPRAEPVLIPAKKVGRPSNASRRAAELEGLQKAAKQLAGAT